MKEWTWTVGRGEFIGSISLLEAGKEDTARHLRLGAGGVPFPVGFVSDLEVHPARRKQGWAHTLLDTLTAHADRNKIDLWTYVSPFGELFPGADTSALICLYEDHGFELVTEPEYEHEMLRRWRT